MSVKKAELSEFVDKRIFVFERGSQFELLEKLPPHLIPCLKEALAQDPRPSYIEDVERIYGFRFDKYEIAFLGTYSVSLIL